MELRQLRYFVAVAEELHFGRAAERLHIVQPAVSQQIGRLEREFGVRLFDRSSRHVRLTDDGRRLLERARRVLAAAADTATLAAELAGRSGVLRLGAGAGLERRVERGLTTLRADRPDLAVTFADGPVSTHLDALRRGDLHAVLVRGAVESDDDLVATQAWSDEVVAALPAGHPRAGADTVRVADLAAHPARLPAPQCDGPFHRLLAGAGVRPLPDRPAGTVERTLLELAGSSDQWAPVPAGGPPPPAGVRTVRFDPPLPLPGVVVTSARTPADCRAGLVAAFGGPDIIDYGGR
ncbi:LysR family transcriptional regulator [Jiangella sp. DSM 45060]|uniref:LysR family transcriptional regulator n=1 Tax=Jiangella sp. DSM 45060 TaxID=1798224 RepID=UPI00087DE14B|nr:LysR family transcriptional regulator [Jiangella sp. DSM 45060]SDT65251.1 DNA-binding transcriptional regulator, LysR family [Jiangella sp. DSM 45060]